MYTIVKGNTSINAKAFDFIVKEYPHMSHILSLMYVSPDYALENIWVSEDRIVFYFHQSMGFYFNTQDKVNLCLKYGVSLQMPGNQDYSFSISIDKVSKEEVVLPKSHKSNCIKRELV